MAYSIALVFACLFLVFVNGDGNVTQFPYHAELDPDGKFHLYWNFDDDSITCQVHAATKGWAAIGFSPTGGMGGADIALFWVDQSGKGMISDRHAAENDFPPEDTKQDYTLISSAKNDTHLVVTFSRKRNTCDKEDWLLTEDTTRMIYAMNDDVPQSKNNFNKHTFRGSKSLRFFDKKIGTRTGVPPVDKDATQLEIRVDQVKLPDNETTLYWCEVIRVPKAARKLHIIKSEPIIQAENIDVVHHTLVYVCPAMAKNVGTKGACFDGKDQGIFGKCMAQVLAVWAVGGEANTYPNDIGMPLPNDIEDMVVMIEMHYDNSQFKKGKVDSSGMRFWVTEKLRPIEAGQATFGLPVNPTEQVIPPGAKEFINYGYCSAECTDDFPKDGLKIMGGLLHTHLAGRKIRFLQFRHGKQLPPIMTDDHYDFNYQDFRHLNQPVTILPGDELVVECIYETLDRDKITYGGFATHDEMCLIFADYYPAVYRGFSCISSPDKRQLYKAFGVNFAPANSSNPMELEVLLPNGDKKNFAKYLKEDFKPGWTPEKINQFQQAGRNAKHNIICMGENSNKPIKNSTEDEEILSKANDTIGVLMMKGIKIFQQYGYPNITEPLVVRDVCGDVKKGEEQKPSGGESSTNKPVPQELKERNAGEMSYKAPSLALVSFFVLVRLY